MIRSVVLGLGSYVPERVVANEELRYLDDQHRVCDTVQLDTDDAWIRARTGIESRRYVDPDGKTYCSDLALPAAQRALADAGIEAKEVDCIILATLSPDIHFPGTAVFLQKKLGVANDEGCACYDIRQQCSGFIYGMQMADAFIRGGVYRRVMVVGSELHSHSLEFATRGRDVTVLFGDGAGAMIFGLTETDDPTAGISYTHCGADGSGAMDLHLKVFDVAGLPYVKWDARDSSNPAMKYPQMNGKKVFLNAVRSMVMSVQRALAKTGLGWSDIDWFVPHQANLRINEAVVQYAEIPPEKALNTIQFYGNTTAATVPLTLDHHRQAGTVKKGDLCLATVFGAGFTWGSAIFRV
jgi:3-oxoacyl-[acyl-carrier-protein] synthase-3